MKGTIASAGRSNRKTRSNLSIRSNPSNLNTLSNLSTLSEKEVELIQKMNEFGAAVEQAGKDYSPSGIANYCYDVEPSVEMYRAGDRIAVFQIAGILELPEEIIRSLPSFFPS